MLSPELVLRSLLDERLFATTLSLICWNQGFQLIQQGRGNTEHLFRQLFLSASVDGERCHRARRRLSTVRANGGGRRRTARRGDWGRPP